VLISERTARHVKATFELQDMGEISLKGKAGPVAVFEVIRSKASPGSGRGFEELYSPLVGRSCELAEWVRLLGGETLKRQTLLSICRYFQRLAEKHPTVVVFENLHWADSSSLEALEELLAVTDRAPLMLPVPGLCCSQAGLPDKSSTLCLRQAAGKTSAAHILANHGALNVYVIVDSKGSPFTTPESRITISPGLLLKSTTFQARILPTLG
jgi:hypothetical protein